MNMGTILWAIDPQEPSLQLTPEAVGELQSWAKESLLQVLPVHVLVDHTDPTRISEARKDAIRYLAEHYADWAGEPIVFKTPSNSRGSAVDTLLSFAREKKVEMIAVSSHGRSGAPRWVLGSFAERLLARSEIPVLFLAHPSSRNQADNQNDERAGPGLSSKRVLFATDFSDVSNKVFEKVLEHCKVRAAELVLFHQIGLTPQVENIVVTARTMDVLPDDYFEEARAGAQMEAKKLEARGRECEVPIKALIVNKRGEIAPLILEAARSERVGLIALASQAGPFASALLGSVARGVFRPHDMAVWVFGPKFPA